MPVKGKPWTPREDAVIRDGRSASPAVTFEKLAQLLGRSLGAVCMRAATLGLVETRNTITPEMIARAWAMRKKDRPWKVIGTTLGVGSERLRLACIEADPHARLASKVREALAGEIIPCLGCSRVFRSRDRRTNRLCAPCSSHAGALPAGW